MQEGCIYEEYPHSYPPLIPPSLPVTPQFIPWPLPVLGRLEGRGHLIFTELPHGQSTESLVRPAHKCMQTHTHRLTHCFQPTIPIMGLAPDSRCQKVHGEDTAGTGHRIDQFPLFLCKKNPQGLIYQMTYQQKPEWKSLCCI